MASMRTSVVPLVMCFVGLALSFAPSLMSAQRDGRNGVALRVSVRSDAGAALGGAQLRLGSVATAETDDAGVAIVPRVASGAHWLRVRRLGYRPESLFVQTTAGLSVDTSVTLRQLALDLAPITVVGRRDVNGPLAGFYRRQSSGNGRFITRAEIDRRNPLNVTDLLRTIPGFRVDTRSFRNNVRVRGSRCAPLVWLDGQGLFAGDIDLDAFDPRSFEGIEIYSGAASVPVEFQGNQRASSSCGTILLWSRRGELREPKRKKDALSPAAQIAQLLEEAKVFTAADVDRVALMDSLNIIRPIYPDSLFDAQTPGRVLAEFVVGVDGRVDVETFSAVTTTHRAFVEPVRRALREQQFAPASRQGRAVQQVVQQPFTFVPDSTARRRR